MKLQPIRPRRYLFATWEGGGNIAPTLTGVRTMVERSHEVAVLCDDATAADVRASGARVMPWRRAPNRPDRTVRSEFLRDWEAPTEPEGFALVRDRLFVGPAEAYARDVLDAIEAFDPDVVVPNDMLFGAILGAEAAGKPIAVLSPNLSLFPIPGLPPFGPGFFPATSAEERERDRHVGAAGRALLDVALPAFNQVRTTLGLAPIGTLFDLAEAVDRILLATSRAFDYPLAEVPDRFRYIGPLLGKPAWAETKDPAEIRTAAGHILVAFSTTYQDQAQALRNAIEAIEGIATQGIVTLGPAMEPSDFRTPDNVSIVAAADHDRLMATASAVITHAGHGTVMRSLRAGVPLVCLPMGRDQNDTAARVDYHGVGVRLRRSAEPREIRAALQMVLSEPRFALRAQDLRQDILSVNSEQRLIEELEALAQVKAPDVAVPNASSQLPGEPQACHSHEFVLGEVWDRS